MLKVYYADVSPFGGKELLSRAGKVILKSVAPDGEIAVSKNGKPYFVNLPMYFNISHSYPYVVCAFADCEVGADVETIREVSEKAASRVFTDAELEALKNGTDFLNLWTAKESVIKAAGEGMLSDSKKADISGLAECDFNGRKYYLTQIDIPHCVCYVATEHTVEQIEIEEFNIKHEHLV